MTSAVAGVRMRIVAAAGTCRCRVLASTLGAARVLAHGILRQLADRKPGRGQLLRRQRPQEIRLILARIPRLPEERAPRGGGAREARVMSRRDGDRIPRARATQQRSEL